ncbi:site-specific DNA-methyltransferase [Heliorestis acidaminivorans]|uniref:Site-specific DNA-methyltransferase n=1 Tax=Heliorestis acidaminivorans TaxID=553427 RepID=A0A6I0F1W6_9FIRM|nr:site-specific DNA-methyltransferase [Heliorestis acidaminivorans]KAB2952159.1 site-specific DNA-methyltransferase [Heliorestis acidaminivorans]
MPEKQKLELTWIGKYDEIKLEPRILIEDPEKSYGDTNSENMLIHGDNLLALKALEQDFAGKIKCIYIDPPYNTGSAFEYYDDNLEHSTWLNLMYPRLRILNNLLADDGIMWISIDDNEVHYLKVMLDEIFGRNNFLANIAYERSGTAGIGQGGTFLVNTHEFILVYAKNKSMLDKLEAKTYKPLDKEIMKRYSKILKKTGTKIKIDEFYSAANNEKVEIYQHKDFEIETISLRNFNSREAEIRKLYYENFNLIFRTTNPQKENSFQQKILEKIDKDLYSVEYVPSRGKYKGVPTTLYYYNNELFAWLKDSAEISNKQVVKTNKMSGFWRNEEIPKANLANEGGVDFKRGKKPEALLKTIIDISTNEEDWVLDSFLGSGTTAAVAQKMNRKWVGIELGDHAYSHCLPRLKEIINGTDVVGVSKAVNWKGGGGFRFYELAPSLLKKDKYGNWIIDDHYNSIMLAAAMCKQEGFTYSPDKEVFWKQGKSTEKDYIFTTTTFLSREYIEKIHDEMQPDESLLICCKAYQQGCESLYSNITIKKIPQAILGNCEFGKEDYKLNIPVADLDGEDID